MVKSGNSPARIFVIAFFALSCFSLLLFLWLSFGGSIPLKSQGYRVKVSFPDAVQLAEQADVRVAGVSVGKVSSKELDPAGNRTLATIQLDQEFAPLKADARAILRQKTLLGETYVELTTGSERAAAVPEGGRLDDGRVSPTVEFDELVRIFDEDTRDAFRLWQRELARSSTGRGQDLNDAFASLPGFTESANDVLDVLNNRRTALKSLVQDTGTTFEAITRDEDQLQTLITDTATVFDTTAAQREQLAETFRIFPTFLDESKATLARLETFSRDTNPLITELRPALEDLNPTLADIRRLAPDLRQLFLDLDPLIEAGDEGFPALGRVLTGISPVFERATPFLSELNPLLQFVRLYQDSLTDFISVGGSALAINPTGPSNGSLGHALPQMIVTGSQSIPAAKRTPDNRGNAYFSSNGLIDGTFASKLIPPTWDCANTRSGGEQPAGEEGDPACSLSGPVPFQALSKKFPQVKPNDYSGTGASARRGQTAKASKASKASTGG